MANCVIFRTGSNQITHFVLDAVKSKGTHPNGWNFIGSNLKVYGSKDTINTFMWTNDDCQPVLSDPDENGRRVQIGWDKTVSEITPAAQGTEIAKPTHNEVLDAYGRMKQVADMSFAQLDTYIENNVTDLASAKAFLKVLAKAVLATIKIQAR